MAGRPGITRSGGSRAWRALRRQVLARDGWTCGICGLFDPTGEVLQADHRVERRHGGQDSLDNLQTLCQACHKAKTASRASRSPQGRVVGMREALGPGVVPWAVLEAEEAAVDRLKRSRRV